MALSTQESSEQVSLTSVVLPNVGDEFELTVSYAVSPDNFVITTRNTEGRYCWSLG